MHRSNCILDTPIVIFIRPISSCLTRSFKRAFDVLQINQQTMSMARQCNLEAESFSCQASLSMLHLYIQPNNSGKMQCTPNCAQSSQPSDQKIQNSICGGQPQNYALTLNLGVLLRLAQIWVQKPFHIGILLTQHVEGAMNKKF